MDTWILGYLDTWIPGTGIYALELARSCVAEIRIRIRLALSAAKEEMAQAGVADKAMHKKPTPKSQF